MMRGQPIAGSGGAIIIRAFPEVREFLQPRASVLASGAFDPLHYGHVRYIQAAADNARARKLPLVVAVAPDEYVKRRHPLLQPLEGRMEMLDALRLGRLRRPQ